MKKKAKSILLIPFLILFLLCVENIKAQEANQSNLFVRVFNKDGKKISKGYVDFSNDSILYLNRKGKVDHVLIKNIGFIKTKRSSGHNVLMGASIGVATASVINLARINPDDGFILDLTPDNAGEALVGGVFVGGILGSTIGAITIPFKKQKKYIINGDQEKLKLIIGF